MIAKSSDYNGTGLVAVAVTFLCLTYIAGPLRVFVRLRITKAFAADDWFVVIAQLIFTCSCSFIILGVHCGLGRHNKTLSLEKEIEALKYQALATLFYVANMMFIKISIALFLLRIATQRRYICILKISAAIIATWSTAIFLYDLFQCWPIESQWNYTITDKKCVSGGSFVAAAYSISVMTIISDWLYALLPIPMIWSVKMSMQTKITVAFLLSLGIFASVAALIRLKYLIDLAEYSDILYNGTESMIWTLVEPGLAIIAASLITMRPLLRAMRFPGFESNQTTDPYPRLPTLFPSGKPSNLWNVSFASTQAGMNSGLRMARLKPVRLHTRAVVDDELVRSTCLRGLGDRLLLPLGVTLLYQAQLKIPVDENIQNFFALK